MVDKHKETHDSNSKEPRGTKQQTQDSRGSDHEKNDQVTDITTMR